MLARYCLLVLWATSFALASNANADCNLTISKKWNVGRSLPYSIQASSIGFDCKLAVALLVIRDEKGEVVYTYAGATRDNGIFGSLAEKPATNLKFMRVALTEWLRAGLSSKKNSLAKFLPWKKDAAGPTETPPAEFPFMLNSDISREIYEEWRKQDLPVLCFVQGIESERCVVLTKENTVSELGIQSFPG